DNLVNQRLASRLLEKLGHVVTVAATGRAAVEEWRRASAGQTPFDLVFMDVQMPEMDGLEATKAIRAIEAKTGAHIPISAMTAHAMQGDRERCLAAGMDGYLTKPIVTKDLEQLVQRVTLGRSLSAPSAEELPPEAAAAWDVDAALAGVDGDHEILADVVAILMVELPPSMAILTEAIAARDPVRVGDAAHALKGAVSAVRAGPAQETAARLEAMGRDRNLTGVEQEMAALVKEVAQLIKELAAYLGRVQV
ncbi:MAG: response regulator, partial [Gemmatimonadota bacterium]